MEVSFCLNLSELNTLARLLSTRLARLALERSKLDKNSDSYRDLSDQIQELDRIYGHMFVI